jgi:hypothetical protein
MEARIVRDIPSEREAEVKLSDKEFESISHSGLA